MSEENRKRNKKRNRKLTSRPGRRRPSKPTRPRDKAVFFLAPGRLLPPWRACRRRWTPPASLPVHVNASRSLLESSSSISPSPAHPSPPLSPVSSPPEKHAGAPSSPRVAIDAEKPPELVHRPHRSRLSLRAE